MPLAILWYGRKATHNLRHLNRVESGVKTFVFALPSRPAGCTGWRCAGSAMMVVRLEAHLSVLPHSGRGTWIDMLLHLVQRLHGSQERQPLMAEEPRVPAREIGSFT